jgi:hypothetical protein
MAPSTNKTTKGEIRMLTTEKLVISDNPIIQELYEKQRAERRYKQGLEFYDKDPGLGAIEYARQFVKGAGDRAEMLAIFSDLMSGDLQDPNDKRVKRCDHCGYYWRDDSKRNNRKVCSEMCRKSKDALRNRKAREKKRLLNLKPRKKTLMDDYVEWLEYPYWLDEYSMTKIGWKHEKPYKAETLDFVSNHQEAWGNGNRRKSYVNYDEGAAEESYSDYSWDDGF